MSLNRVHGQYPSTALLELHECGTVAPIEQCHFNEYIVSLFNDSSLFVNSSVTIDNSFGNVFVHVYGSLIHCGYSFGVISSNEFFEWMKSHDAVAVDYITRSIIVSESSFYGYLNMLNIDFEMQSCVIRRLKYTFKLFGVPLRCRDQQIFLQRHEGYFVLVSDYCGNWLSSDFFCI